MPVRLSFAILAGVALVALAASHSTGRAKPPDLPQFEKPVCAPQCPANPEMTPPPPSSVLPMPIQVEHPPFRGGQEESEVRRAADRHAAMRRLTRCLLFGTHPLLPLMPVQQRIDDAIEDSMEPSADQCDPHMVHPATRF